MLSYCNAAKKKSFCSDRTQKIYSALKKPGCNYKSLMTDFGVAKTEFNWIQDCKRAKTYDKFTKNIGRPSHLPAKVCENVKSKVKDQAAINECVPHNTEQANVKTLHDYAWQYIKEYERDEKRILDPQPSDRVIVDTLRRAGIQGRRKGREKRKVRDFIFSRVPQIGHLRAEDTYKMQNNF